MTITKEQAVQLAREAGVVDGPKILMMATTDDLHHLAQAAYKLGRNQALEDIIEKLPHILAIYRIGGSHCTHFIESLKDNTT